MSAGIGWAALDGAHAGGWWSAALLAYAAAAFVLGGFVKGTLGAGLPLIVVPLLYLLLK